LNAGVVEDGDDIGRPPAARIGSRLVRLSASAMATTINEDQPSSAPAEQLDIAGLVPGFTVVGQAVEQNKRVAGTKVFVRYRHTIGGHCLGNAVRGRSFDQ